MTTNNSQEKPKDQAGKDDGLLEKIANAIDPAGTDVTDDEIMDPGANIQNAPGPSEKESRRPPEQH